MGRDYYDTLGIPKSATDADIKNAYRRLAPQFHPSCSKDPGSFEKFRQLAEAFDVLSDPRKKATYDKFGDEGLRDGLPAEICTSGAWSSKYVYHGDPHRTFRHFFGNNNPFADFNAIDAPLQFGVLKPGVEKVQDPPIERELHLSLDDMFLGCTKKIKISRRVMNEDGQTSSIKDKILTIDVKPGWKEGTRIVFPKEGDQSPHNIPADIVFIVRQKNHPLFERQNADLIYNTKITLAMALIGFSVDVETLDGRMLSVPINDIVHLTYRKVVIGEGMPLAEEPSQRGDLIITFDIQFPEKLSAHSKQLIKQALLIKPS